MTGALYWRKVGRLEIGTYINSDGHARLVMRGECSVDMLSEVIHNATAVTLALLHDDAPGLAAEQSRTGALLT